MPSIDKKKKTQQNKILYIFLTAFFVTLVTLIYLATAFTPDIDVDVNSDNETSISDVDRQDIDSRLKEIQQDELIGTRSGENESSSDIIQQLKRMKEEAISKQMNEDEIELQNDEPAQSAPATPKPSLASPEYTRKAQTQAPAQTQTAQQKAAPAKMAKVYVGRYSDFDQAIKVQDALIQSSLASSPFIKNLGGYYVIQVGSYANMQTAQNIAENLITNGYSARMVLE